MAAVFKTLALIVLLAVLGYGGFYAGQYLRHTSPKDIEKIRAADFIPGATPLQPAGKPYAATPSVGPLTRSVAIKTFFARDDGTYGGIVAAADSSAVATGQSIVFYDRAGTILPVVGYIGSVDAADDGDASFTFKLDTGVDDYGDAKPTPDLKGAAARVVTLDTVAKRLPLPALVHDTDGNTYIWKAVPDDAADDGRDAHRITLQPVSVGVMGDSYFEVGQEISTDDLVIINPAADLEDAQVRDILIGTLNAPLHGYARLAEIRRNDEAAQQAYLNLAAFQAVTTPGGLGACPANISAEGLPADILSIQSPLDGPGIAGPSASGASGGCSSCGAPAASTAPGDATTTPLQAPAATGGCGGCGGGSYGGEAPQPVAPDAPAATQ